MSQAKNMPRKKGSVGGPFGGPMITEKPKNFSLTIKKLFKYMKTSIPSIIVALVFAVASVILVLNVPNFIGDATDKLMEGAVKMTVYDELAQQYGEQNLNEMAKSYPTLGDFMKDLENIEPIDKSINSSGYVASIPEQYNDILMSMRLDKRPTIDVDAVVQIIMVIIILVIVSGIVGYVQSFILAGVAQKVSYNFRKDIYEKINHLPLKYFDTTTNGEVLSYLTNDVDAISMTLNQSLSQMISSIVMIVGVLVMMIRISLIMTALALVIIPISLVLITIVVKISQKHFIRQQRYLGEVNGHIEEMYSAHNVVQLYNGQKTSKEKFSDYNTKLYRSSQKSQFLSGLMMPIMFFIGNIGYVMVCVVGGILTIRNKITVGNILAFVSYMRQFNQPLSQAAQIMNTMQSTAAAAERVFGFLEAEEEKESGEMVPQNTKGDVEFKNVHFGYNPDKIIINDFSSNINAGDRVAIVGPTGAGKTTIVKLLMRFYDINSGQILLDGKDISIYKRDGLRTKLGMVLQDTWLFCGSLRENIRYGNLSATDEQVENAAKIAYADHFIKALPNGYDFVLNEDADNISQGQKQLLTIARAILADPKVLILDEATSSVDTRTEILINKAMDRLMKNRTSFIIAHRLSTIRDADKILVMKDGDIVEQGSHSSLMQAQGFYYNLYNSQFA